MSQEVVKESFLRKVSSEEIAQHGHQVLLGLHVVGLVAVVVARESEFHDEVDVLVLGVCLFLELQQVVEWVVEVNISLDDLVSFYVKLLFR